MTRAAPVEDSTQVQKSGPGRPRKPQIPELPPDIAAACSQAEIDAYYRFVKAFAKKYAPLDDSDMIMLMFAGIESINALRLYAKLMKDHEVLTQARQSPLIQMRGLLADLGARRRDRLAKDKKGTNSEEQEQMKEALEALAA